LHAVSGQDANFNPHGFLLVQGNYTTIDVPGATIPQAYGINDAGLIPTGSTPRANS
jgi:hypothetical protein